MKEFKGLNIPEQESRDIRDAQLNFCEYADCDFGCKDCLYHGTHLEKFKEYLDRTNLEVRNV